MPDKADWSSSEQLTQEMVKMFGSNEEIADFLRDARLAEQAAKAEEKRG